MSWGQPGGRCRPLARRPTSLADCSSRRRTVPRHRELDGTCVLVDISGFTSLSEQLARRGRVGTEDLVTTLAEVFSALLSASEDGGDVLKFAGDALLLAYDGRRPRGACLPRRAGHAADPRPGRAGATGRRAGDAADVGRRALGAVRAPPHRHGPPQPRRARPGGRPPAGPGGTLRRWRGPGQPRHRRAVAAHGHDGCRRRRPPPGRRRSPGGGVAGTGATGARRPLGARATPASVLRRAAGPAGRGLRPPSCRGRLRPGQRARRGRGRGLRGGRRR